MDGAIKILQTPRALSNTEKRVLERIRSGDRPGKIMREMRITPDCYRDMVVSIREKGYSFEEDASMKWTDDEMATLYAMKQDGATDLTIAEKLGRTPGQVAVKYCTMRKCDAKAESAEEPRELKQVAAGEPGCTAKTETESAQEQQSVPQVVIDIVRAELTKRTERILGLRKELESAMKDVEELKAFVSRMEDKNHEM